jgi:hypothetical protein
MTSTMQFQNKKSHPYNGIHYELVGRIGDIARRAFYPQQATALKKDEVQHLNAALKVIAAKMEGVSDFIDTAVKRTAAAELKRT